MPRRPSEPADLNTQHGRLRWAREHAGFSSIRGAAVAHGWNENTYKSHEQGIRRKGGLPLGEVKKYARAFGVSDAWLLMIDNDWRRTGKADFTPQEIEVARKLIDALSTK